MMLRQKRGSTKRKLLSQEDHLAIAVKTEQENTKRLNAMVDHVGLQSFFSCGVVDFVNCFDH